MKNRIVIAAAGFCAVLVLGGCAPTIKLAAPEEPVKVDINMNVNVTSRKEGGISVTKEEGSGYTPETLRRNRVSEVQALLGRGVVGVNRQGLLELRPLGPADTDKDYIAGVVTAENKDRNDMVADLAKRDRTPPEQVRLDFYRRAVETAQPGTWIEELDESGSWSWTRKK